MIEVYVQTDLLEKEEIIELSTKDISADKIVTMGFSPEALIMILMECGQNIGYNAIYDSLKYIVVTISNKLNQKEISKKMGRIVIDNGDRHCEIEMDFPISEETFKEISLEAIKRTFKD